MLSIMLNGDCGSETRQVDSVDPLASLINEEVGEKGPWESSDKGEASSESVVAALCPHARICEVAHDVEDGEATGEDQVVGLSHN